MATTSHISHTGGWVEKQVLVRPKTRLFAVLSVLWLGVVAIASTPFWTRDWRIALSGQFSDSNWVCILLSIPEVVLVGLVLYFRLTERPLETIRFKPDTRR